MDFESFFVSSTLKKRLLNNSKATINHAGIHEFPLNDLLDHHSQEIIASEFLQCLASREHAQNKKGKRKHRFSVSIVQSSHYFDEMEGFQHQNTISHQSGPKSVLHRNKSVCLST